MTSSLTRPRVLLLGLAGLLIVALLVMSGLGNIAAAPKAVGYYRMGTEAGHANQVPPILASGNTPVQLLNLTAADLAPVAVLFIENPSNGSYGAEFLANLANIATWVANGGVMVFHDRFVDPAETVLPGGAGFNIIRDFADDTSINILNNTTLVTSGPGGVITNTSLDGGNSSSHGYAVQGTLPGSGKFIFSRTVPTEIVTFSYCFGKGAVVYSSIPLDFYLDGSGVNPPRDNMRFIYAPNVVAYGAAGASCAAPPTPTPTATATPAINNSFILGAVGAAAGQQAADNRAAAARLLATPTRAVAPPSTGTGPVITAPSTGDAGLPPGQPLLEQAALAIATAGAAGVFILLSRRLTRGR